MPNSRLFQEWLAAEHDARVAEKTLLIQLLAADSRPDDELHVRVGWLRSRASSLLKQFVDACAEDASQLRRSTAAQIDRMRTNPEAVRRQEG